MKASKFTDAQKAFVFKQGADGHPVAEICRKAGISEATYFKMSANPLCTSPSTKPPPIAAGQANACRPMQSGWKPRTPKDVPLRPRHSKLAQPIPIPPANTQLGRIACAIAARRPLRWIAPHGSTEAPALHALARPRLA